MVVAATINPELHQRTVIRRAALAALLGDVQLAGVLTGMNPGAVALGSRIVSTRIFEWREKNMPAISIYNGDDVVEPQSKTSTARELERSMPLVFEVGVLGSDAPEEKLDIICREIERILHADETLGGACQNVMLAKTEFEFSGEGERIIGVAFITYTCDFITYAPYGSDQPYDEFLQADVHYNLSNAVHPDNEAVDDFEVRGA